METKIIPYVAERSDNSDIIAWSENYATGIELIDNQHRELVNLTNALYRACLTGKDAADAAFKDAMSRMVEYVRFHFAFEQKVLASVKYPDYSKHKKQHETLIRNILQAVKKYEKGVKYIPNNFVRTLRDWVFGHIAVFDKTYSLFIIELKKKGLFSEKQLED